MTDDAIHAGAASKAVGRYPHARRVGNTRSGSGPALQFLSGIGPRDPSTDAVPGNVYFADGRLRSYDIAVQTRAVLAYVHALLEAGCARWEDLVDVTVYLTDMTRDFKAYNAIWAEFFPDPTSPLCRTTLGISALSTPIVIELKCVAAPRDR